jgi:hydrogenase 3 maturation protease
VGHAAPENLTGEIKAYQPSHLVIVDAAHLGQGAGAVDVVPAERIGGVSFSTHTLPMPIIIDYLVQCTGCAPLVVGIEPAHKDVCQPPSEVVLAAVESVVASFKVVLEGYGSRAR